MYARIETLETRQFLSANLVADFNGFYPTDSVQFGNTSYFTANDGAHGTELWKSDGTAKGTQLVRDITSGAGSSDITQLTVLGKGVIFLNRGGTSDRFSVWYSDGTRKKTTLLATLPKDIYVEYVSPQLVNGHFIFTVVGAHSNSQTGTQLWSSDGTVDGTRPIAILAEEPTVGVIASPPAFINNRMLIPCESFGLWSTDGTAAGTFKMPPKQQGLPSDIQESWSVASNGMAPLNGKLLMPGGFTNELWITDGTVAGTTLLARPSFHLNLVGVSGGKAYLWGRKDEVAELWISDGTTTGTHKLASLDEYLGAVSIQTVGNRVYLFCRADQDSNHTRIWMTDGTPEGTELVASPALRLASDPVLAGGKLFYATVDNVDETQKDFTTEFWTLNPSDNAIVRVVSIERAGVLDAFAVGGFAIFQTWGDGQPGRIWKSDGTSEGTEVLKELTGLSQFKMQAVDGRLVMSWLDNLNPDQHHSEIFDPALSSQPLAPAQGLARLSDGTLRIYGTDSDDLIRVYRNRKAGPRVVVNINGVKRTFDANDVKKIVVYGYAGDDRIEIQEKLGKIAVRSRISGGAGDDTISTGSGQDTLYGDEGNDRLSSSNSSDWIFGGDGNDSVNAGAGNDTANGDDGTDSLTGGDGSDLVSGGNDQCDDWLDGGNGQDVVFGQAVYDIFYKPAGKHASIIDDLLMN